MTLHSHTRALVEADIRRMPGTVDAAHMRAAVSAGHPLLVAMDALYRAAVVHSARYESKIADDYFLGPYWLKSANATRGLFNGDFGKVSNGTLEALYWSAMDAAGFTEGDS